MVNDKSRFPWSFLIITFGFTWLILLPGVLASQGVLALSLPMYALVALAQFGPSLTAFLLTYRNEGKAGVQRLWRSALDFHIGGRWLAVVFLLMPALAAAALGMRVATGGRIPELPLLSQPIAIVPLFLFTFLLSGPVPEEFGWRGYLLPRLQSRWSALIASVTVGFFWWLWHLPASLMQGVAQSYLPQGPYLLWIVAFSVLMTWVYNNTGGNLLAMLIFHTMANVANALFPTFEQAAGADQTAYYYLAILTLVAAAVVVWRWGPERLSKKEEAPA